MNKTKEAVILTLLTLAYLVCGLRYFPDNLPKTFYATARHLFSMAPFIVGSLFIINSLVKKTTGERLSGMRMARIYLAFGITIEFFLGIYNYLNLNS